MKGYHFTGFRPDESGKTAFEKLLDIFLQLLTYTNGDVAEALQWLNQLDRQYELTNPDYGMGDFIDDLKKKAISMKIPATEASRLHQRPNRVSGKNHWKKSLAN